MKKLFLLVCVLCIFVPRVGAQYVAFTQAAQQHGSSTTIAYVNDCGNGGFGSSGTISSTVTVGGAQCKNSTTVSSGNVLVASEYSTNAATTLNAPTGTCVSSWTAVSNGTGFSKFLHLDWGGNDHGRMYGNFLRDRHDERKR